MKKLKVVAHVPHDINLIDPRTVEYSNQKRKYYHTTNLPTITQTIKKSGILLSAQFNVNDKPPLGNIPDSVKVCSGADLLPEDTADVIIVSAIYYTAHKALNNGVVDDRLRVIIDPVFSPDFKFIVGCLKIGRVNF